MSCRGNFITRMEKDKREFYKEQAEKFRAYLSKSPGRDLVSLFDEWVESKDFSDEDRQAIFAKFLSQFAKNEGFLIPKLKIHLKDDPVALHHLLRIIVLALRLAETDDKDEIERIQKNFLDID